MKRIAAVLLIGLALAAPSLATARRAPDAAQRARITRRLARVFDGMATGNLRRIRPVMSRELYRQYRVLFEQNTEYPQFLRDFYRDTTFQIEDLAVDGGRATASVRITNGSGETNVVKVQLRKERRRPWKIGRIL